MSFLQSLKPSKLLLPTKFRPFYKEYKDKAFSYLDIGCGSHSPSSTKEWFPNCTYHGVDKQNYGNDERDFEAMDRFFSIDLVHDQLDEIPDNHYNLIMMSHVIEHLENGDEVLKQLLAKLKPNGKIYIEYPGEKSLSLPSKKGTLNFCDDETHVRVYSVKELANICLQNNCKVIRAGTRRDPWRVVLFPLLWIDSTLRGTPAGAYWDVTGFAEFVYAEKK